MGSEYFEGIRFFLCGVYGNSVTRRPCRPKVDLNVTTKIVTIDRNGPSHTHLNSCSFPHTKHTQKTSKLGLKKTFLTN